jgi:hypothetical protein
MKKFLLSLLVLMSVVGCSKKYTTNVSSAPVTELPPSSIEAIISEENDFRLSQGSLPLSRGLTCSVAKFAVMPALLPASLPTLEKISYTHFGNFNQSDSNSSDGLNIIPSSIRANYTSGYMIRCTGQLVITEGGLYNFGLRSDDGAKLLIDGSTVILDDGVHSPRDAFGSRSLRQGVHSFQLDFMQNGGAQSLQLFANGALVPSENFYR